ncbi:MAG: N-formylglutamate amidohydrolase [Pararhodobacter sp.]|nr:N-formylglutamate amidohydrolase [Pararhodobacter sp.]
MADTDILPASSGGPSLTGEQVAALAAAAATSLEGRPGHPLLLVCEHAGAEVPAPWNRLGLHPALFDSHFAFDPGAAAMTRALCDALGAPGVLARYSRLFLDYNRRAGEWEYMRPDMGGMPVPANLFVSDAERAMRQQLAAAPLAAAIEVAATGRQAMISVHSFTPVMNGVTRALDIGVLGPRDCPFAIALSEALERHAPEAGLRVARNAPYDWHAVDAYCLQHHAVARALPCVALEFNNATLAAPDGFARVLRLMADTLGALPLPGTEPAGAGGEAGQAGGSTAKE